MRCSRRREVLQPLERQRQVAPPLVARHGVDLVHDHRAHAAQHFAGPLGGENQIERFGVVTRMCGGRRTIS